MSFLERIRSKPTHVRTWYALSTSFVVTALIGIVWISTLPARFGTLSTGIKDISEDAALLNSAKENVANTIDLVTDDGTVPESGMNEPALIPDVYKDIGPQLESSTGTALYEGEETEFLYENEATSTPVTTQQNELKEQEPPVEEKQPEVKTILIGTTTSPKAE